MAFVTSLPFNAAVEKAASVKLACSSHHYASTHPTRKSRRQAPNMTESPPPPPSSSPSPSPSPSSSSPGANSKESDQWEQYEYRDPALMNEKAIVQAFPNRQRHTNVFFHTFSMKPFLAAADRFIKSAQSSSAVSENNRLWLLQTIADPTFGNLQGEPHPMRCVIVYDARYGGEGEHDNSSMSEIVQNVDKWVDGLDRAGGALSPMESHSVDWAVCAQHVASYNGSPLLFQGDVVAFEVINANWTNARTVSGMRRALDEHGRQVVGEGFASSYEVLQSVDAPTCFKTVEVYPSVQRLSACMKQLDEPFATDMMQFRAAVNRVRQLHKCIASLSPH